MLSRNYPRPGIPYITVHVQFYSIYLSVGYFLFVINLITRTKEKYRMGRGLKFCRTVQLIIYRMLKPGIGTGGDQRRSDSGSRDLVATTLGSFLLGFS